MQVHFYCYEKRLNDDQEKIKLILIIKTQATFSDKISLLKISLLYFTSKELFYKGKHMKNKLKTLLILTMSVGLSGLSLADDNIKPNLSKTYQESYQAAWDKAGEGELPVYECTRVVTTASKMLSEKEETNIEAQQAYKACYVDAILHYTDTYFKLRDNSTIGEDAKPNGCSLYSRYLKGHVISLEAYAERFDLTVNDLNNEIHEKLLDTASLCKVDLN